MVSRADSPRERRCGSSSGLFAGGPTGGIAAPVHSMQRVSPPGDGALPENWVASPVVEGGVNVSPDFRNQIRATPGEHTE